MCTGIVHVLRCVQCKSVVSKLKEAAPGYTCHQARKNRKRGLCRTGIDWATYDRVSEEDCLFCEIYLGGELSGLTADNCDEGGEPWPEDREDDVDFYDIEALAHERSDNAPFTRHKAKDDDVADAGSDDDDDDDDEEGGAKLY
ncbi:hypothetical protein F5Y12DRAFT_239023 [Xylaria sp. FL1777]|nr:hypothetical protein F5Y12DRAFT_239023 [Xylaria sp. FL1777]